MRGWVRVVLFAISYFPLYLILLARSAKGVTADRLAQGWINHGLGGVTGAFPSGSLLWIVVAVLSLATMALVLKFPHRYTPATIPVKRGEKKNGEALNYIVTYVVPFMAVDQQSAADLAALCILFAVMCYIYINSNLVYTNPTLAFIGYAVYAVETEQGNAIVVVSRRDGPIQTGPLSLVWLSENVYLEVPTHADAT